MSYRRKQKKGKKIHLILASVMLLALCAGIGFFMFVGHGSSTSSNTDHVGSENEQDPENDVNYGPPTDVEKDVAEQQKNEIVNQSDTPSTSDSLSVVITRATQNDTAQPVAIRVLVYGTTSGTCTAIITRDGQPTITKTSDISFEATSSSCQPINIPASEFSVSGQWNIAVTATSSGRTSATATNSVTVNK